MDFHVTKKCVCCYDETHRQIRKSTWFAHNWFLCCSLGEAWIKMCIRLLGTNAWHYRSVVVHLCAWKWMHEIISIPYPVSSYTRTHTHTDMWTGTYTKCAYAHLTTTNMIYDPIYAYRRCHEIGRRSLSLIVAIRHWSALDVFSLFIYHFDNMNSKIHIKKSGVIHKRLPTAPFPLSHLSLCTIRCLFYCLFISILVFDSGFFLLFR